MKFKKGDTVKIIGQEASFHSFGIVDRMERKIGTIQVIENDEEYGDEGGYDIDGYTWHEDDLELTDEPIKKDVYTRLDIITLLENIASYLDTEWNGDSDTYEASIAYNEAAEVVRSYKADYE